MAKLALFRTDQEMPSAVSLDAARQLVFGIVDGATKEDKRAWRRFWKRIMGLDVGELIYFETVFPRHGKFHRLHMALESAVFNGQEKFHDFDQFRNWLKIGAGWVTWAVGPKGGVVPLPNSISYAAADEEMFQRYHAKVVEFLRGPHAAPYLWKHLKGNEAFEMMETLIGDFE